MDGQSIVMNVLVLRIQDQELGIRSCSVQYQLLQ